MLGRSCLPVVPVVSCQRTLHGQGPSRFAHPYLIPSDLVRSILACSGSHFQACVSQKETFLVLLMGQASQTLREGKLLCC